MRIQTASSAAKGMEKLWAGGDIDLVLLDPLGLSSLGTQWVNDMRNICTSKQIPILTLSARTSDDRTIEEELGAVASLSKPSHPALLLEALCSVVAPTASRKGAAVKLPETAKPAKPTQALRILLADDNHVNRRVATLLLASIGYEAYAVESGPEALEALRADVYDVVFMDVQMPGMDGFEASRAIWREFPEQDRPYIIAMTAHAMFGDKEKCLAAGMDSYISKPIDVGELQKVLNAIPVSKEGLGSGL